MPETTTKKSPKGIRRFAGLPGVRFFLQSKNVAALMGKCLLLFVIPYAYLILCGVVFDLWLKWYFMTTFIFVSLIVLYLIALAMVGIAIYLHVKDRTVTRA